ncbi:MAG: hypothetical protein QOD02_5315 [Mycobacterium sp.]|nr:hypothetical protein [Mycobacterium sp.]MDT5171950.1 hypothetical protein [Mycobacterium sp.]
MRLSAREPEPIHGALADAVLRSVPEGARLQYGPDQLGTALLRRAQVPLRIDTGMLTDAVVDLTPSATYLLGGDELYGWADGRPILRWHRPHPVIDNCLADSVEQAGSGSPRRGERVVRPN